MINIPLDITNSTNNPWLMETPNAILLVDPNHTDRQLTAEYIWSLQGADRERLVNSVFDQYRKAGFESVLSSLSSQELTEEWESLKKSALINEPVNGEIINSCSTGTIVLKHFCSDLFYASKGSSKSSMSCEEVFNNDEKLLGVLQNRMGYKSSKEDGKERPYVFAMSNKMLLQGMRSSGMGYMTSTFKPAVARTIYRHMLKNDGPAKVFDFSAGWGARALGAGTMTGIEYYAIDPLTADSVNNLMSHYGISGNVFKGCSEDESSYEGIIKAGLQNTFETAWSSPPYFNLEVYSNEPTQSINRFPAYDNWLKLYWSKTVKNVKDYILTPNGSFAFTMVDKIKKIDIATDMVKSCEEQGFSLTEKIPISVSRSHLSKKATTKIVKKSTEHLYVFRR